MIARYATAITIGAGVTFGLLFLMQMLIASGRGGVDEARDIRITDFVRVERHQTVERREQKPERPPEPQRPPDAPNPDRNNDFSGGLAVSVSAPNMGSGLSLGLGGLGITDGEFLPIVRVAPVYPQRAAQMGLEGYVIVEFTVTPQGTTRDAFVVESSNRIFDRAAVDAALRFRYRPRVVDGQPIEVVGVQNRFTFVLDN